MGEKIDCKVLAMDDVLTDSLQRPLRDLRISVTDRCNFRCGYCMPKDIFGKGYPFLKQSSLLSCDQVARLVRIFAGLGVHKIRLTGGEPLLRQDLEELVRKIAEIPGIDDIALTTNASLLSRERALSLNQAGIRRLNISLDALTPEIYARINQIPVPLEDILSGVAHALEAPYQAVKINMVVQKGVNDKDILPMVEYFRGSQAVLRFIEFMDVGNHNQWNPEQVFASQDIVSLINRVYPIRPASANYPGEVARRWRYEDGQGEIGVISSVTQPFCGDCARARLSARGELFTCLFATAGFDLKKLLEADASDTEITSQLRDIWGRRTDRYSMERLSRTRSDPSGHRGRKVEMSYIGG